MNFLHLSQDSKASWINVQFDGEGLKIYLIQASPSKRTRVLVVGKVHINMDMHISYIRQWYTQFNHICNKLVSPLHFFLKIKSKSKNFYFMLRSSKIGLLARHFLYQNSKLIFNVARLPKNISK
jgi:hypothetical protein